MKHRKSFFILIFALICSVSATAVFATDQVHYDFSQIPEETQAEKLITRAEFSRYLWSLLRKKEIFVPMDATQVFEDVDISHAYYSDIMPLKKLSIINGDGNGNFRPGAYITYEEAAAMISRILATDYRVMNEYGGYPTGYIKFALSAGLFNGVTAIVTNEVTLKDLYIIMNHLDESFETYDILEKLGCDTYNGDVYIDYYPKEWQGFGERPIATSNGYFKVLPSKLLYSYDNQNWNPVYEDIDGKRVFYNLPDDIEIEGTRYAWEYGAFVSSPHQTDKNYYSYDYKTWQKGMPVRTSEEMVQIDKDFFVMGIEKESIIKDTESGLYFAWQPYETNSYMSKRYATTLWENRYNMIWVSKDLESWIGVKLPDSMMFFVSAGLNSNAKALQIDGAVSFSEEEKEYIQNESEIAASLNQGYDVPEYKIETYMLYFEDVIELLNK